MKVKTCEFFTEWIDLITLYFENTKINLLVIKNNTVSKSRLTALKFKLKKN